MIAIYALISVFIAWIWVDYFRLIEIFEKGKLKYFILTFILGGASVLFVFGVEKFFLAGTNFTPNGHLINDFFYFVFHVGLVEEIAKMLPFLIILFFFKKQLNEPIDYVVFICISALGFSAVENTQYFLSYGDQIIVGRAVLASVGHMIDSTFIAYGIISYKYKKGSLGAATIPLFILLAALTHGIYDLLLSLGLGPLGVVFSIIFFFFTVSLFARIINNALNLSPFFTYKKVVQSDKVMTRLLVYYAIIYAIQFFVIGFHNGIKLGFQKSFMFALGSLFLGIFSTLVIIIALCTRLSRFKLIEGRWEKLRLEFPFYFTFGGRSATQERMVLVYPLHIHVKGASFDESYPSKFYEEYFRLYPMSPRRTYLGDMHIGYIERKLFLKNDETYYLAKVFDDGKESNFEYMLLKPKLDHTTRIKEEFPIMALLKIKEIEDIENEKASVHDFPFMEWVVIKPLELEQIES